MNQLLKGSGFLREKSHQNSLCYIKIVDKIPVIMQES
jgi:hypothetical protein